MKQWTIIISFIGFFLSRPTAIFSAETALKIVNVAVPAFSLLQAPLLYRAHHFIEASSNSTRFADALYRTRNTP